MSKQLNVDLRFNADVSGAKAQLQSLQQSVAQLTTSIATQGTQLGITPQLQQAQQAAVQLKTALQQSMNVETGKFDLSKFNSSLKSMNMDLSKLKTQLVNLGPSGQQTFMTLAQSIMTAEIPTKRISGSLAALGTTLKNTAKWQLSSTMLHGFMSAVQTSYRYAQDLNESLNNIRIVTGESAAAMDKFAARANKAAKALSASTLDYTNAALIFYQQGLGDREVEERTNVTVKLANVSRQTVEVASDQLTAIWNNFDDGTKSLEYYADVLTALGAATASSTDEIAGGLEKFAAVGETIGLSYEYAASALATITANTRQSEEVVGTALKTIFARIQGLKLGETLEDGVDLNKYSEALKTVDVSVLDEQTGELRNMDSILSDLGGKWQTLSKAQQTALAQTVAGVRQYTQFVSLMDNWDDGTSDSMMANLNTANNSTGALQEQADIYAESWEGASKRVKASLEEVYMDLLDDDFFIKITNGLADILGLLDNFLDAMGGAKGLLSGLGSILLNMFSGSAAKGLENMVYNFRTFIGLTQKETAAMQAQVPVLTQGLTGAGPTNADIAQNMAFNDQITLNHTLLGMKEKLSEQDQLLVKGILDQNQAYQQQLITLGQVKDATAQEQQNQKKNVMSSVIADAGYSADTGQQMINSMNQDLELSDDLTKELMEIDAALEKGEADIDEYIAKLKELEKRAQDGNLTGTEKYLHARTTGVNGKQLSEAEMRRRATGAESNMSIYGKQDARNNVLGDEGRFKNLTRRDSIDPKAIEKYTDATQDAIKADKDFAKGKKAVRDATKEAQQQIQGLGNNTKTWSQTVVGAAQSAMSLSFAINSIKSLGTTWADENIGVGEKLLQTFMSLGMALPMLMNGLTGLNNTFGITAGLQSGLTAAAELYALSNQKVVATLTEEQLAKKLGISTDQASIILKRVRATLAIQEAATTKEGIAALTAERLAKISGMTVDQATIVLDTLLNKTKKDGTKYTIQEAMAEAGLTTTKGASVIATVAQTVANWALNLSMSPILLLALLITAALIALTAVVWGVVTVVNLLSDAYNADAIAAERANAALKQQQEVLADAKAAHEELIEALGKYDEAYQALQKMTEGTEEWAKQAEELNQIVVDLITKYPELAKYVEKNNGVLTLNKEGMEIAKEKSEEKIKDAEINTLRAQRRANSANMKDRTTQMSRKGFTGDDYWETIGAYTAMGATADLATGGASMGVGTLTGFVTGVGAAIAEDFNSEVKAQNTFDDLFAGYAEQGEAFLASSDSQAKIDELSKALGVNKDEILNLIRSNQALNETNRLLLEKEAKGILDDNKDYQGSKYKDAIDDIAADKMEKTNTITDEDRARAEKMFEGGAGEEDYTDYLTSLFGESYDPSKQRITNAAGGKVTLEIYNEETKQWEVADKNGERNTITNEEMIEQTAQMYADQRAADEVKNMDVKKINAEMSNFESQFKALGLHSDGVGKAVNALATGKDIDLSEFSEEDLNIIREKAKQTADTMDKINQGMLDSDVVAGFEQMSDAERVLVARIQEFDANGGVLGAKNASYKEIFDLSNETMVDTSGMPNELQDSQEYTDVVQRNKQIEEARALRVEIEQMYSELSEEDKKIFAEDIDFKKAKTREFMEQELAAAKEKRAFEQLDSDAAKYELDAEVLKKQTKMIMANTKGLEDNAEAAAQMAVANQRMNKGVDKLTDGWKDWKKALNGTDKTSEDYAKALVEVEDAMRDILSLGEDVVIPEKFLQAPENIDLLDAIANGSEEAVAQLHFNLSKAQIEAQEFTADVATNMQNAFQLPPDADLKSTFETMKANALDALTQIQQMADGVDIGKGLKDPAKQAEMAAKLNEYALATGMTADQMQSFLSSVGVQAKISMIEGEPVTKQIPITKITRSAPRITYSDELGVAFEQLETSSVEGYTPVSEPTLVPQIEMQDPKNPKAQTAPVFTKVSMGNIAPSVTSTGKGGGGGGGGGNKPKKPTKAKEVEPTEKKEADKEIERYYEMNEVIEDLQDNLDELSKKKERAWGGNKITLMRQERLALEQLGDQYETLGHEIDENLGKDKAALEGIGGKIDPQSGRLLNYDELMDSAVETWNDEMAGWDAAEQAYENRAAQVADMEDGQAKWDAEDALEEEKKRIDKGRDKTEKKYSDTKDKINQYTETLNKKQQHEKDERERQRKIQDLNYEEIMYTVEVKVEVNDYQLKILDHQRKLMEDDWTKTAELMGLSMDEALMYGKGDTGILDDIQTGVKGLEDAFKEGKISEDQYMEGLQKFGDMAMENREKLYEMNKQMQEYYGTVLDAGLEKIKEAAQTFEDVSNTLNHYKDVLGLIGQGENYTSMNEILRTEYNNTDNAMQSSKATQEMLKGQIAEAQSDLDNARTEEEKKAAEERLKALKDALREEEESYREHQKTMLEIANEMRDNTIKQAFKDWENAQTNGLGYDTIIADMEKMDSLTSEYLTGTNKMYETNKMIAQAQQSMEKSSNNAAKQKYQDYIKYIEQLQKAGNLTKSELETAQARFKVLEAEMALEDAKDAKSQVRLTRDSEGNFGYVYTANEDNVQGAQQNYLDAQNELYNLGVEHTQEYREKTIQLQKQTHEELLQLELDFANGVITSQEEYEHRKQTIQETSNALLQSYQEQFNLAQATMVTTSYSFLMENDKNFYNGQLSTQKNSVAERTENDAQYYGGLKTTAEETQKTLKENLGLFNQEVNQDNIDAYAERLSTDKEYYETMYGTAYSTAQGVTGDLKAFSEGISRDDIMDYKKRTENDGTYYGGLDKKAQQTVANILGYMNGDKDSLQYVLNNDFQTNMGTALTTSKGAIDTWKTDTKDIVEELGLSFDGKNDGLTHNLKNVSTESENAKKKIIGEDGKGGLVKALGDELTEVGKATRKWYKQWEQLQDVNKEYDKLITNIGKLIKKQAKIKPVEPDPPPAVHPETGKGDGKTVTTTNNNNNNNNKGNDNTNSGTNKPTLNVGDKVQVKETATNYTRDEGKGTTMMKGVAGNYFTAGKIEGNEVRIKDPAGPNYTNSGWTGWVRKTDLVGFKTGGYTGDWGPEGKMAMLHEKEIVLNAEDTKNFLAATMMLREISQILDYNAQLASLGAIQLQAMNLQNNPVDQVLQQEVTIHADFPNVTNHIEIETALNNLINAASQYANKN